MIIDLLKHQARHAPFKSILRNNVKRQFHHTIHTPPAARYGTKVFIGLATGATVLSFGYKSQVHNDVHAFDTSIHEFTVLIISFIYLLYYIVITINVYIYIYNLYEKLLYNFIFS